MVGLVSKIAVHINIISIDQSKAPNCKPAHRERVSLLNPDHSQETLQVQFHKPLDSIDQEFEAPACEADPGPDFNLLIKRRKELHVFVDCDTEGNQNYRKPNEVALRIAPRLS